MQNITRLIRLGATLAFAFALAVGYSTGSAAPVSASAASAVSDCDSDPYCHWTPIEDCVIQPCWTTKNICCWP